MLNEITLSNWLTTDDIVYADSDDCVVASFYHTFQIDDPHQAAQILVNYTLVRTLQLQHAGAPVAVQANQLDSLRCVLKSLLNI